MKILNWNVNGLRAILKKDYIIDNKAKSDNNLVNYFKKDDFDIICLNETKLTDSTKPEIFSNYEYQYYNQCKCKKGYSGTAILSKYKPIRQIDDDISNDEGRMICLEFKKFYLINIYAPNSGVNLKRLEFKLTWINKLITFISKLEKTKEIIICGDYNIAPNEIDLANPTVHTKSAGFTNNERESFVKLVNLLNLTDVWRYINPYSIEFTYFDYRTKARERNIGWRIDHFLISKKLIKKINNCKISKNIYGSDHLPIVLDIDLKTYQI
jgi:exodeoxyribonuclease-3